MQRTVNVFMYFLSQFQFSFTKSSVIVLSFLDLKVSQESFSIIKENLIVLDSQLHCYSCIRSELAVFSSVESKFSIPNCKVLSLSSFFLEKKLISSCHLEK